MSASVTNREKHIEHIIAAELQFRLAAPAFFATRKGLQPFDLPFHWSHPQNRVSDEEVVLQEAQAFYAANYVLLAANYFMALAIQDAINALVPNANVSTDSNVHAAYQISRLIRDAFTAAPCAPMWSIDQDSQDEIFVVPDIIMLNTTGLQDQKFDWAPYGGPLALFRLCRFVRHKILGMPLTPSAT